VHVLECVGYPVVVVVVVAATAALMETASVPASQAAEAMAVSVVALLAWEPVCFVERLAEPVESLLESRQFQWGKAR